MLNTVCNVILVGDYLRQWKWVFILEHLPCSLSRWCQAVVKWLGVILKTCNELPKMVFQSAHKFDAVSKKPTGCHRCRSDMQNIGKANHYHLKPARNSPWKQNAKFDFAKPCAWLVLVKCFPIVYKWDSVSAVTHCSIPFAGQTHDEYKLKSMPPPHHHQNKSMWQHHCRQSAPVVKFARAI